GPVREQTSEVAPAAVSKQPKADDAAEAGIEFAEGSINGPQPIEDDIVQRPEEPVFAAVETNEFSQRASEEGVAVEQPNELYTDEAEYAGPAAEPSSDFSDEPIGNDQTHETIFTEREAFAQPEVFAEREAPVVQATTESISDLQRAIPAQPVF